MAGPVLSAARRGGTARDGRPAGGALAGLSLELAPSARLVLGAGALDRLAGALPGDRARVLLVTDAALVAAGVAGQALDRLEAAGACTAVFDAVAPNPTTATVAAGVSALRAHAARVVVAVGGGSVLDAAKALAWQGRQAATGPDGPDAHGTGDAAARDAAGAVPLVVAVPTTAGTGAETNGFAVIEDVAARAKVYLGHPRVRPGFVVLDPLLTLGLPPGATAATGMDALVHGIESLVSRRATPLSAAPARQAVAMVAAYLARAVRDGGDLEARAQLLLAAHLAGTALSLSGLGLVHGIAHAVTARTGAAHGIALSAVLAEVMSRTVDAAGPGYTEVAGALGVPSPRAAVDAVDTLAGTVGARRPLAALGLRDADLAEVAAAALADPVSVNHPRRFSPAEVEDALRACR